MKQIFYLLIFVVAIVVSFSSCGFGRETKNYDLSQSFTDTLIYEGDGSVFKIDVCMKGKIDGSGTIEIRNNTHNGGNVSYPSTLKENFDISVKIDWYSDTCIIKYTPLEENVTGNLSLTYKFGKI
ncbi:hypothetical protein [Dysgonomonas sp. 520]|uniref:hypothetical protein n=1 Tax=Dysgonomonas sp. 520 TaxID=2302931 RepID=UPI0013D645EE|nr:hypothetical protein [Dysgonomonas sp. 520]NDW10078.1 hypothetical protein [Dysgonomonas sp. 520]